MGEHRTQESIEIIDAIAELGEALGYTVRREWQIPKTGPVPEQVDIAFFADELASAPAFAIEVDSADVPASTSNAVKIFGKTTEKLIKPFFVFHVFVRIAADGHRRENTETLLITHNYKTYDFGNEGRQEFIQDLLARHRAISSSIDLYAFGSALDNSAWNGLDRYQMLDTASNLLDTGECALAALCELSITSQYLENALIHYVCKPDLRIGTDALSFTGRHFLLPLMFGLRAYGNDVAHIAIIFEKFKRWQAGNEIIFSPDVTYLGLSQDFDLAIVEIAPLIFCMVAMLFAGHGQAAHELCAQLYARSTDGHLSPDWKCFALGWCTIAALAVGANDIGRKALAEINAHGGLPVEVFPNLAGPSFYEDEPSKWESAIAANPRLTSLTLDDIKQRLRSSPPPEMTLPHLVARILIDDEFATEMNQHIASQWTNVRL